MKKMALLLSLLFIMVGCAKNSGVVSLDGDTYKITKSKRGISTKSSELIDAAHEEAFQYCQDKGKNMMRIINLTGTDMVPYGPPAQAEIEFQCL